MDTDLMPHRSKNQISRTKQLHRVGGGRGGAAAHENQLIIKLPSWRVWRVIARSVLLATAIVAFPWVGSMVRSSEPYYHAVRSEPIDDLFYLQMLFQDLSEVGLLRSGDRAILIGEAGRRCEQILKEKMDLVSVADVENQQQASILNETYDFAFADGFSEAEFMGRVLKLDGVMAVRMSGDPLASFWVPLNFKIVYIRQFDTTVIAMRKTGPAADPTLQSPLSRRLCAVGLLDARKAELMNRLEDVPLEPPHVNAVDSGPYLDNTRFLPDLIGDQLDGYPRRVFVDVGPTGEGYARRWFELHYPKRKGEFEIHKVETAEEGGPEIGVSEWLTMNVREEEYVVMRAEADVVEEMAKSKAICLVDELFLECNPQGQGQNGKGGKKRTRAYWECLNLLGKLRDEGIAVHQWWA